MAKYFTFPRAFRINRIEGFTYGPVSYTFQKLRKDTNKRSKKLRIPEMEASVLQDRFKKEYDIDFGRKSFEEREELNLHWKKTLEPAEFYLSWNCISLHVNNSTVDFAVKDDSECLALLHVLHHKIYGVPAPENKEAECRCLAPYIFQRFRMKCSFEAWRQRTKFLQMFKDAIQYTMQ